MDEAVTIYWLEIDLDDTTTVAFLRAPNRAALSALLPDLAYDGLQPPGRIDGGLVTADTGGAGNLSLAIDNGRGQLTSLIARIPFLVPARLMALVDGAATTVFAGAVDGLRIAGAVTIDLVA
jgi:hypothetical protein